MRRSWIASTLSIVSLLAVAACGGSGTGTGGGGSGTTSSTTGEGASGGQGTTTTSSTSTSTSTTTVTDCADISSNTCFSNDDCAAATDHCDVVGMSGGDPVACCVDGPRGTGKGGDPCTVPNDCDTAVCLFPSNVCSSSCANGELCPNSIPNCVQLMGFKGAFCTD